MLWSSSTPALSPMNSAMAGSPPVRNSAVPHRGQKWVWISWRYEVSTSIFILETRGPHVLFVYAVSVVLFQSLFGAFGAYLAMIRLLGENLRIASGDGEVDFWDLEDLGVV
jgi:hypothetical protein